MKSRGLHLIREPKCGTVVTASAGTIAPPDMELFHDKVPAQLVELAEKVYEQNPLFLADRYSVTSRAQPPATPITVDEGFLFLHSRLPGAWWGAGVFSPPLPSNATPCMLGSPTLATCRCRAATVFTYLLTYLSIVSPLLGTTLRGEACARVACGRPAVGCAGRSGVSAIARSTVT